jgi:hypothetical protein
LIKIDAVHKSWAHCSDAEQTARPSAACGGRGSMINGLNTLDFSPLPVWHGACSAGLPLTISEDGTRRFTAEPLCSNVREPASH